MNLRQEYSDAQSIFQRELEELRTATDALHKKTDRVKQLRDERDAAWRRLQQYLKMERLS